LYEAFVIDGKYPYEPGYLAVFGVQDKASGLEIGKFRWSMDDSSEGSEYTPNPANVKKLKRGK